MDVQIFDLEVFLDPKALKSKILTSWGYPNRSPANPTDGLWMLKSLIWRFVDTKTFKPEILISMDHPNRSFKRLDDPLDVKIFDFNVLGSKNFQIKYLNMLGLSKSKLLACSQPNRWPLDVKIFDLEVLGLQKQSNLRF